MKKIIAAVGVTVLLSACGMFNSTTENKGDRPAMAPSSPNAPDKSGVNSGAAANTMRPGDRPAMAPNTGAGPDKSGVNSGAASTTTRPTDKPAMAPNSK